MSKRKRTSPNIFSYLWRELLFAHYFELESNQSPAVLADMLRNLTMRSAKGIWLEKQAATVKMNPNGKEFTFKIAKQRKHPGDLIYLTTARARGKAIVDGGTGKTLIRGAVTFGRLFHGVLMGYLLYLLFSAPSLLAQLLATNHIGADLLMPPLIWLLVGGLLAYYWRRIYNDRNQLAAYLKAQLRQADLAASQERLSTLAGNVIEHPQNDTEASAAEKVTNHEQA